MGEPEGIGDIHNYLDNFSPKDVGGVVISKTEVLEPPGAGVSLGTAADASGNGQYFVDQTTGQYYFQSGDGGPLTVVSSDAQGDDDLGDLLPTRITDSPPPSASPIGNLASNRVVLNTGGDQFQTVTIVPNDTSGGEVSYVLIVQPNEEKKLDNEADDNAVYDFDAEDQSEMRNDVMQESKPRIGRHLNRKTQSVTSQSHICRYCSYSTSKRYLLSRHMKSHSEERPHKCSVCERGFKTLTSLQNHVNTHTGTKPHGCSFCQAHFTTSGELVRHVRYRHTHEKPHKCTECDYESVELSKLKRHMRCHSGERPYQCPHCTYASPDTFKLKRHLRIHTGEKPYQCDVCQARFSQSNSLKAHKAIHTGDKPQFQCELCPATCGRKTDLRQHVQKLHISDKPMMCKMCNKSFPDRYTLKVHKKTHEGEKCFKCELCPYSSSTQRHLEMHMLVHTDQKPFECDQCDQCFRQKQLLKRHQNLYHNPSYVPPNPKEKTHECIECKRSFRHKGNLVRHMAMHDPEMMQDVKGPIADFTDSKKIQIGDKHQVNMFGKRSTVQAETVLDDEDQPSAGMTVEGPDGQYFVVLEVTQLEDGADGAGEDGEGEAGQPTHTGTVQLTGPGPTVQIAGPTGSQQINISSISKEPFIIQPKQDSSMGLSSILEDTLGDALLPQASAEDIIKMKKEHDRATCFGFDDDDDE